MTIIDKIDKYLTEKKEKKELTPAQKSIKALRAGKMPKRQKSSKAVKKLVHGGIGEGKKMIRKGVNPPGKQTHVCKKCGWKWKGTADAWSAWKGPCPECGAPKSQFT